jgi:hypothetical protein
MPEDMEDNGADVSDPVSENEEDSETFLKDEDEMADPTGANGSYHDKKKYDPKDPLRPRRKKARRACFACQRAHLTCGAFHPRGARKLLPLPYTPFPAAPFTSYPVLVLYQLLSASLCPTQISLTFWFSSFAFV